MRIEQLTFTRFLAAISIVVFHYGSDIYPFNNPNVFYLFRQANVGVSYFFILSGFVMIIAYNNKSIINSFEYYKNRFARIYPVSLLAILLLVFYNLYIGIRIDYYGLILNLFVIQAWVPGKALLFNTPEWSLSVEILFYALFPLLFNFIYNKKDSFKKCIIPIIGFFLLSQFVLHWAVASKYYDGFPSKSHDLIYYFPLMHLNEFLIGNLAGLFFVKTKRTSRNFDWLILLAVASIILILKFPLGLNFHNGVLAVIFVPMILSLALNKGLITKLFRVKQLVFLGEISFGIYILQLPVNLISNLIFDRFALAGGNLRFYLFIIVLVVISSLSYVFFETPIRDYIKKTNKGTK